MEDQNEAARQQEINSSDDSQPEAKTSKSGRLGPQQGPAKVLKEPKPQYQCTVAHPTGDGVIGNPEPPKAGKGQSSTETDEKL